MSKICPNCKTENPDSANFCGNCQAILKGEENFQKENVIKAADRLNEIEQSKIPRPVINRPNPMPVDPPTVTPTVTTTSKQYTGPQLGETTTNPAYTTNGIPPVTQPYLQTPSAQSTSWYKKWYIGICAIAFALLLFWVANPKQTEGGSNKTTTSTTISPALNKLEGNYALREKNAGTLVNGIRTAAIKKSSDSQARILVTSEYGPDFYDFTFTLDGKTQSEQLGTGEITYNERLDKITITFKQGERVCEFTK